MTNLDSILKSRDINLPTKVHLVKVMVFPVVMCGCESWTVKRAERRRIDAFELWCWRRLLRVPWTARRSNQSILKEISPECLLILYWTGTQWSRVNDESVKEGKRLIFPGLCSQFSRSRESVRNRERERKKERHGNPSSDGAKVF